MKEKYRSLHQCDVEEGISPFSVNTVVVDPVGDGRHADAALEHVALVSVLGQDEGGDEASVRPAPDSNPGGMVVKLIMVDIYFILRLVNEWVQ